MKKCILFFIALLCAVASKSIAGNPIKAVDLGLSVKWALCNVGANNPWEYGNLYEWGVTPLAAKRGSAPTGEITGTQYDIAHTKWKGSWRIPTYLEINELKEECSSGSWSIFASKDDNEFVFYNTGF